MRTNVYQRQKKEQKISRKEKQNSVKSKCCKRNSQLDVNKFLEYHLKQLGI